MGSKIFRALMLLALAIPALADDAAGDEGFEKMPWDMSADEQAAIRERLMSGQASASNCAALNSSFAMKEESIRKCIAINNDALQKIWRDYLQEHPGTQGTVTVALDINSAGRVISSGLTGSLTLPLDLAEQIRVKAAMIIFPASAGGWNGNYAFRFQPE